MNTDVSKLDYVICLSLLALSGGLVAAIGLSFAELIIALL